MLREGAVAAPKSTDQGNNKPLCSVQLQFGSIRRPSQMDNGTSSDPLEAATLPLRVVHPASIVSRSRSRLSMTCPGLAR